MDNSSNGNVDNNGNGNNNQKSGKDDNNFLNFDFVDQNINSNKNTIYRIIKHCKLNSIGKKVLNFKYT